MFIVKLINYHNSNQACFLSRRDAELTIRSKCRALSSLIFIFCDLKTQRDLTPFDLKY